MGSKICAAVSRGPSNLRCFYLYPGHSKTNYGSMSVSKILSTPSRANQTFHGSCFRSYFSNQRGNLLVKCLSSKGPQKRHLEISLACQNLNMKLLVPKKGMLPKIKCNVGPVSWPQGCASAGLIFGLLVCCSNSEPTHAEASHKEGHKEEESCAKFSHGKKVYTDYSITGIPGDGRCLFRSVAHGACLRSGKPAPNESLQRELADDLRAKVADEFIKRREETEWFVEGDFDTYVSHIKKPHVWGGEPELFLASHVLQEKNQSKMHLLHCRLFIFYIILDVELIGVSYRMPITVYMYDEDAGGLISIAEYGQEYGKENPIRVLYHGFGHYDALQMPRKKSDRSRL
ncbi:OVARIAN TUMOR DOMAIN-containing deubiquitinating enzyme 4 isoform X3 [Quercus robur]|nr:OVARIAN TUMOR DOMAIN-containing deubiquitinating enzyme 4 isoform X3 [Quercus robur]XP_050244742.1 OVARIAN TUMOR DOMAIN-containing deubiquitinating enzyme 4 isoform X3 [Quercus robur]XP_050244743.1 OVARIAN TUMOR DOMAIN-containing deubiquitinating enzyme 4 isoform X3 [Quercus robur]